MFFRTLSGRFLLLTLLFVLLAEVIILVPSISRFREEYILTRLERAQIASLALLASDGAISDKLAEELKNHVEREIGPIARPAFVVFSDALPKTRSGKIMRRILRKIAEGELKSLGDTSTLLDPAVVDEIVKGVL